MCANKNLLYVAQLTTPTLAFFCRCTADEKSLLYKRLDPTGAGVSCRDLVSFVEAPTDGDNHLPDTALVVMPAEGGEGKMLRRAQATIVEAAQVRARFSVPQVAPMYWASLFFV